MERTSTAASDGGRAGEPSGDPHPPDPAEPGPDPWSRWLPPVLAYLVAHLQYALVASQAGFAWFSVDSRLRWDSGLYLDIAQNGYELYRCGEDPSLGGYAPDGWCGNTGWYPLYSYLIRVLSTMTGLRPELVGVLIAEACALGALILVWHLLGSRLTLRNLACLALAIAIPAGVYYHAVFPMSLTALLTLVTFLLLRRGNWALAGLVGGLTAMSYSIGVLLAPAVALYLVLAAGPVRQRLLRAGFVAGATGLGALAVLGLFRLSTGRFDAQLLAMEKYGIGVQNPIANFQAILDRRHLTVHPSLIPPGQGDQVYGTVSAELLFCTALVGVGLVALAVAAVRQRAAALDWALGLYGVLALVVPLIVGANVAQFRSHTLLLPVVLLLRRLPVLVTLALVIAGVALAAPMTSYFLQSILI
jgi:hypothetical protein